ncbi:serine protease persephone-like [Anopheles nili]|uniref:serine protease persephone-like n=1 Tax=Anopheles nili TaxID=185578 RepID=UPI00237B3B0B|nr:serine protease persephone-like [Anopheles nili]
MWFRGQLLLVLAGVLSCGTGAMEELFEDDPCTLHTGERGVCRRAIACTWLKGAIRSQEITYAQLIRCGFDRDEPIVCCRTDPVKATRVGVQPATKACATYDGKRPQLAYHIVGGSEAESGEVPFIGALGYRLGDQSSEDSAGYKWACGSSLIAPSFLMTAAHCIDTVHGSPVVVRMGTHNLLSPPIPEEVQDRLIKRIIIHPGYKKNLKYDDIALLEVVSPFKFDEVVQPACLTIDRNDLPTSTVLLVAGWGLTTKGDECMLRDGTPGVCTDATACPWFLEVIVKNKRFADRVSCGFDGLVEVICCKTNSTARPSGVRSRLACEQVPKYTSRLTFHIIDGEEASEGEFPFMAALGYPSDEPSQNVSYRCGASLIAADFLLTAAHCIPTSDRPTVAILGTNNLAPDNPGVIVGIKAFFPHPDYRTNRNYHDIALVQLERRIENEPDVNPICLNDDLKDLPEETVLTAEGYGIIDLDRNLRSNQLMKVNLTTVALQKCNQSFADSNLLKNNRKLPQGIVATQYCATGRENENTKVVGDTCQGDSGGPLQILDDGKYKLVGVTSFGNGCGSNTPSVSTRVAAYIDWIESIVWG